MTEYSKGLSDLFKATRGTIPCTAKSYSFEVQTRRSKQSNWSNSSKIFYFFFSQTKLLQLFGSSVAFAELQESHFGAKIKLFDDWGESEHHSDKVKSQCLKMDYWEGLFTQTRFAPRKYWFCFEDFAANWNTPFVLFLNGQSRPLFRLFSVSSIKHSNFTTNQCEKCPASIWRRDSNSQPSDYEPPPLTTRPGLLPLHTVSIVFCPVLLLMMMMGKIKTHFCSLSVVCFLFHLPLQKLIRKSFANIYGQAASSSSSLNERKPCCG